MLFDAHRLLGPLRCLDRYDAICCVVVSRHSPAMTPSSALHLVPYRPMLLRRSQEVDGRRRFYEPRATSHSRPARQIRCESDRVIELLRSLWRGITSALHLVPYRPMPLRRSPVGAPTWGARLYEPRATNHEPLSLPARQIRRGSDRVIELLRSERLSCEGELAVEGGLRGS